MKAQMANLLLIYDSQMTNLLLIYHSPTSRQDNWDAIKYYQGVTTNCIHPPVPVCVPPPSKTQVAIYDIPPKRGPNISILLTAPQKRKYIRAFGYAPLVWAPNSQSLQAQYNIIRNHLQTGAHFSDPFKQGTGPYWRRRGNPLDRRIRATLTPSFEDGIQGRLQRQVLLFGKLRSLQKGAPKAR